MHPLFKRIALTGSLWLLTVTILSAQWFKSDTLDQVLISGLKYQKYNIGGKSFQIIDSSAHQQNLSQSISEKLPIFFLNRGGAGQLSSINLRGVGGSRTSLLWNNLEINSYTLGESDYTLIPAGISDQITLNLGSNGALFGNGAIGGTINLAALPSFAKLNQIRTTVGLGSFGEKQSRLAYEYGRDNFNFKSAVYYFDIENDFSFPLADTIATQRNAAYQNIGMLNDLYFKPADNQMLSLNAWYNFNHRQIQPQKFDLRNNDQLTDRNFRLLASYSIQSEELFN
ncbi:MAG: TonB-dependent receptor, partial [Cyclobacteriaceae bacterium]